MPSFVVNADAGIEVASDAPQVVDSDVEQLKRLGYEQQLRRSLGAVDSIASSIACTNLISSIRASLLLGLLAGGPLAMWTSFIISLVSVCITAAILSEICSALPISGSLYNWAAAAAGPKYGRFVGFVVAWWVASAWVSFVALGCEWFVVWVLSLCSAFNVDCSGGITSDNIKWRILVWAASESFLVLATAVTYLPSRSLLGTLFRVSAGLITLDFFLCITWLPIGASRKYGLHSGREVFLTTFNGTGAPAGWNWMLSFVFTSSILTGFDAPGHFAEETKKAGTIAPRSMFRAAVVTGLGGLLTTVVLLFCIPDWITALFALNAPEQPFALVYVMALGRGGGTFMTLVAMISALFATSVQIHTASRIVFAIARDGALPLSDWLANVSPDGLPRNAVTAVFTLSAILLCTILPSMAAFTSIISAATVQLIASYGLIALLRLTMTPNVIPDSKFHLGRARKLMYAASMVMNAIFVVTLVSPFTFPVTAAPLNFGGVLFAMNTIISILSYLILPDEKWLSNRNLQVLYQGANEPTPAHLRPPRMSGAHVFSNAHDTAISSSTFYTADTIHIHNIDNGNRTASQGVIRLMPNPSTEILEPVLSTSI